MNTFHYMIFIGVGLLFIFGIILIAGPTGDDNSGTRRLDTGMGTAGVQDTEPKPESGPEPTPEPEPEREPDPNDLVAIEVVKEDPIINQVEQYVSYSNDPVIIERARNDIFKYIGSVTGYETTFEENRGLITGMVDKMLSEGILKKVDYQVRKLSDKEYAVDIIFNGQNTGNWYKVDVEKSEVVEQSSNIQLIIEHMSEDNVVEHMRNVIIHTMEDWLMDLGERELPIYST